MLHPDLIYDLIQQHNAELVAEAEPERRGASRHGRARRALRGLTRNHYYPARTAGAR